MNNILKNIKYSKATQKDGNAVVKLHSLLYEDDDTKTIDDITVAINEALKSKLIWVAKIDKEIIGYVLCQFFDKDRRYFPNSIFIDGLLVKNEYRKKGVGKTLINMVLKNKFPKQYTYFSITHDPVFKHLTGFYKSFGFTEKGKTDAGNMMLTRPVKENQEIHVDPRHVEHAFGLPFWRDNTKLWALKVLVEEMNIDELLWILDVPFWEDIQGNIVFTPREIMDNPDHYPEHRDKIKKADTSYPIDIMRNKKGKWAILDGLHRLIKLVMEGKQTVRVRKVPPALIHLTARDEDVHRKNISHITNLLKSKKIDGLSVGSHFKVTYFTSGAGTHLYLITGNKRKYLARINYYPLKNSWGVKEQEYKILKKIEPLKIAPKVYYLSKNNALNQHFTIVDYVKGSPIKKFDEQHIVSLAKTLRKLHSFIAFKKSGDTFPPKDNLPYACDIYSQYANGDDKQIEKYTNLTDISKVVEPYNRIKEKLGKYFNGLSCFKNANRFCLVHADLKKENILDLGHKIFLIDWECGGSDIPETDIGNLFASCKLTKKQQLLFLDTYYQQKPDTLVLERIYAVKKVLDFFDIIDDYILQKRKKWNAEAMKRDLINYEKQNLTD